MTTILYELVGDDSRKKFSPHCWKSRLALAHKGINFESCPIRFTEKEKIAFSGQQLVPVLTSNGQTITDSWDIACYLENQYPDQASLFNDEAGKALAASINEWCNNDLLPHIVPIVIGDVYQIIADKDKAYFRESREQRLGVSLEEVAAKKAIGIAGLRRELDKIRELLSLQTYIGGQQPSYGDICLLGMFMWIACVSDVAFLDEYDIVNQWFQHMLEQYPSAKEALNI